ncbi:MAG TPA: hypothetical protein VKP78_11085, partial [bacterium]|nr:hypothetical protein [bacterium]
MKNRKPRKRDIGAGPENIPSGQAGKRKRERLKQKPERLNQKVERPCEIKEIFHGSGSEILNTFGFERPG